MSSKTPFCVYQGAWSIIQRDFERDIIPMCREEGVPFSLLAGYLFITECPKGMALIPWNVIAGGRLRSDAEEKRRAESGEGGRTMDRDNWKRTELETKASRALEKVAKEHGDDISVSAGKVHSPIQNKK